MYNLPRNVAKPSIFADQPYDASAGQPQAAGRNKRPDLNGKRFRAP
jgi:hypothetical protein